MKTSEIYRQAANKIIQDNLKDVPGVFIINYSGVAAADLNILREALRKSQSRMFVSKNSVIRRALVSSGFENISSFVEGPCGVIFAKKDPAASAKVLFDFRKSHEKMALRGGCLKEKVLDDKGIETLASLPSRDVLIAKVVGGIKSPLSSIVFVLNGNLRKLVYALEEVRKKKETTGK